MRKEANCFCEQISEILAAFKGNKEVLITILQKVQDVFGYIPEQAVSEIAKCLKISESEVFGVATFYAQFRFNAPGEHNIKVCLGTACHVRGGTRILEAVEKELAISPGQTTVDRKFDLERVACFGCCALAPVVVIDKKVYAKLTADKIKKLISDI